MCEIPLLRTPLPDSSCGPEVCCLLWGPIRRIHSSYNEKTVGCHYGIPGEDGVRMLSFPVMSRWTPCVPASSHQWMCVNELTSPAPPVRMSKCPWDSFWIKALYKIARNAFSCELPVSGLSLTDDSFRILGVDPVKNLWLPVASVSFGWLLLDLEDPLIKKIQVNMSLWVISGFMETQLDPIYTAVKSSLNPAWIRFGPHRGWNPICLNESKCRQVTWNLIFTNVTWATSRGGFRSDSNLISKDVSQSECSNLI